MHNPFENDCESLWEAGLTRVNFVAATVRLYGDQGKARNVETPSN